MTHTFSLIWTHTFLSLIFTSLCLSAQRSPSPRSAADVSSLAAMRPTTYNPAGGAGQQGRSSDGPAREGENDPAGWESPTSSSTRPPSSSASSSSSSPSTPTTARPYAEVQIAELKRELKRARRRRLRRTKSTYHSTTVWWRWVGSYPSRPPTSSPPPSLHHDTMPRSRHPPAATHFVCCTPLSRSVWGHTPPRHSTTHPVPLHTRASQHTLAAIPGEPAPRHTCLLPSRVPRPASVPIRDQVC